MAETARPSLRRAAARVFAAGLLFRDAGGARPDAGALRAQLSRELDLFAQHPESASFAPEEVDAARFALVAWLDELIIGSEWPGAEGWISQSLQLELYRTNKAGNEFFQRLAALPAQALGAREVYLHCLAQGFRGQHADNEAERTRILQEQYALLNNAGVVLGSQQIRRLTPDAYDLNIDIQTKSGRGLMAIAAGWLLGGLALYGSLRIVVWLVGRSVGVVDVG